MPNRHGFFVFALVVCVLLATITAAVAGPGGPREGPSLPDQDERPGSPEVMSYEGSVHCKNHDEDQEKEDHSKCELEFTSDDGEEFDINGNAELARAVCEKHERHLNVRISAEKAPRFLFWGGDLKVVDYKITGEMLEDFCLGFAEGEELRSPIPTRTSKRKRKGSI